MKTFIRDNLNSLKRNQYTLIFMMVYACCFILGACSVQSEPEIEALEKHTVQRIPMIYEVETTRPFFQEYDFTTYTKAEIEDTICQLENFIEVTSQLNTENNDAILEAEDIMAQATTVLENNEYVTTYTEDDLNLLAWIIFVEAGDNSCSDEEQQLVGQVVMNRLAMGGISGKLTNPTIADVFNERGQYYMAIKRGYNITPWNINLASVTEKCYQNAKAVLEGEVICPENVVYQATFPQGHGIYKSFYHSYYNNTTYFCYL